MNLLRRLPLYRLLVLFAVTLGVGVGATALAFALGGGATPQPKPLAQAIHDALAGQAPEGVTAEVQLTDHLLEGASLAGEAGGAGGGLASSPLVQGGSGRLWIAKDGKLRLDLRSLAGDTEIVWDGHTLELYNVAANTLYRYTPPAHEGTAGRDEGDSGSREVPSLDRIQEAIAHLGDHARVSEATPTDVAGRPAYTVSLSPKEGGSLLASAQLSFDAANGAPLRAAVYSTASSAPVLELTASSVSFGPVESAIFELQPPADVKVEDVSSQAAGGAQAHGLARRGARTRTAAGQPRLTVHGHGPSAIVVLEAKSKAGHGAGAPLSGLPQVKVGAAKASELRTALGTLLSFERDGVRYVLAGSVQPGSVRALASGL